PLIQKIALLFIIILLLYLLPKHLPRLSRPLGKKFKAGWDVLKSIGKPGGPLAEIEKLVGRRVREKLLSKTPEIEKTKAAETVQRIGRRLAACARRSYIPFRFIVVDDPHPNASAIPGGSILITQALLDICPSEDEIAGVLAHEVAHIDSSHYLKRLGASMVIRRLVSINNALLSKAIKLAEELIDRGYSQENEFEADREGARLAKRAGFDPRGLRQALEILEDNCQGEPYSFFDTHPPTPERISELRKRFG
ncbi:MAG: M48 family metallopeptidase, partial [Planctomycetota bacterium]